MTAAKILLDSISPAGHRLTTMEVMFHRYVLTEFNTHRVFSRSSASSRAIPVAKQLERVRNNPAIPVAFPAEQRGMGGHEDGLSDPKQRSAEMLWREAAGLAAAHAESMATLGVHKSVTNRLLEPFMWHTVIVSATDWDGFFEQRCSPMAQPEIRAVAELMQAAYNASTPTPLAPGEWHTPLIQPDENFFDFAEVQRQAGVVWPSDLMFSSNVRFVAEELRKRVSAARCARVSYLTHDGKRDIQKDLELYDKLVYANPPHWSPLEHVATPCVCPSFSRTECGGHAESVVYCHQGNYTGWDQLRHAL